MSLDTHFELDTERLKLTVRPYGQAERYTDRRLNPTSEGGLDATANWLQTERTSFMLHTMLQDASTLYSELTSTGIIHIGQRRRDEDVDGTWSYRQTERWTLQLGGTYTGSDYHGTGTSSLSNFRQASGTATESFAFNEQIVLDLNGSAGDADTAGTEQATTFKSLGSGFQWQPTERTSVQGSVGISRQVTGALASNTVVGSLSVSFSTELTTFALSATRQMQPSGFGIFTEVDQATLTATHSLSERLSLSAEAEAYRNSSAFQSPFISFAYAQRTYAESHLRLNWQQTPEWSLGLQIQYDRADSPVSFLTPAGLHAQGWQTSLQSTWAPPGASVSR